MDCCREGCKYTQRACQVQEMHTCLFAKAVNVFCKVSAAKLHEPPTQTRNDVLFTAVFAWRQMWLLFIYLPIHLLKRYLQTTCNGSLFCRLTGTLVSTATGKKKKKRLKRNESGESLSFAVAGRKEGVLIYILVHKPAKRCFLNNSWWLEAAHSCGV